MSEPATVLQSNRGKNGKVDAPPLIAEERKRVTVMFADIRGSTAFIEKLDPEEVRKHFDPVLRIMMDGVKRYGGTVNQILGDGIMALFGAPMAQGDHAVRACYAALSMQDELRRSRARGDEPGDSLTIGIGLNSGEVVVRSVANDVSFDYSALGQTTHLAARMESLAGPGMIVLTATTLREAEGFIIAKPLGTRDVKGFTSEVETFELTGVTTLRNRLQVSVARGLTSFVGRRRELDFAQQLILRVSDGNGQLLAIVGEAGVGKSRLLQEFLARCLPSDCTVLEAPSASYGRATPYFPLIKLLRSCFALPDGEQAESVRAKVTEHIMGLDPALMDSVPPILVLLDALSLTLRHGDDEAKLTRPWPGLAEAITQFAGMEPQERRRFTLNALIRLLIKESRRQPLLLIFEDLHWIDSETQAFLDELVDRLKHGRIFLWVNYRPGYSHTWANNERYNRLRLTPLPTEDASQLIDYLIGDDDDLAKLKEALAQRTAGNPFFVEESVRSLAEAGALIGSRGNYRPLGQVESVRIPNTVQTVLSERIDRLAPEEKQLLQAAAVIGVVIPDRLLRSVSGLSEERFRRAVANLQAGEFLFESFLFPELEYRFTHALINEVVYGALLHEQRVALHGKVTSALEAGTDGRRGNVIESLAHHAFRGERWEKAANYLRQAGAKAMVRSAFSEALTNYEHASTALEHLPDSDAKLAQQIDLHLECRNVLFVSGDLTSVAERLTKAEGLAERLGDPRRLARVLNFQCSHYGMSGDPERAVRAGRRALELPVTHHEPALLAVARYYTGVASNNIGQYREGARILKSGLDCVSGALKYEQFGTAVVLSAIFCSHLALSLAMTGDFVEGLARGMEGTQIAEDANHPVSKIHVKCSLGLLHIIKGDFAAAIPVLQQALDLCLEKQVLIHVPLASPRLGYAYLNSGRVEEGIRLLEESVERSASVGRSTFLALSLTWLGEGYLAVGRGEDALARAEHAVALARQQKAAGNMAVALKVCADIALHLAPEAIERPEARYQEALLTASNLGMRPLQAHCHAGLGKLHAAVGQRERARGELGSALDLYRAMEMSTWQSETERELGQIN